MSVIIRTDLPLELRFQQFSQAPSNAFPDRNAVYWHRYVQIKQWIADTYYESAGAGLALGGERFTRHDISHVDDVIDMAGRLLGLAATEGPTAINQVQPYELYVLLFGILLHDAGNAKRRVGHEKEPKSIIAEMGPLAVLEPIERRLIASIAEAHGGRAKDGDKDTITKIINEPEVTINQQTVQARKLAAILRFADELAENSTRADPQALAKPYNPPESAIHNLYCKVINPRVDYFGRTIYLDYSIMLDQLNEEFLLRTESKETILLVDYISGPVEKCDAERLYCNRFLARSFDEIRVNLKIYDESDECVDVVSLTTADRGYPQASMSVKERQPRFDGAKLRAAHFPAEGLSGSLS